MKDAQHKRPLILGLALACALAPLCIWATAGRLPSLNDAGAYLYFLALTIPGVLVLGTPFILLLRSAQLLTWINVLVTTVVAGNLYYQFLGIFLLGPFEIRQLVEGTLFGLLAGIGFCIGAWPNNLFKPTPLRGAA